MKRELGDEVVGKETVVWEQIDAIWWEMGESTPLFTPSKMDLD